MRKNVAVGGTVAAAAAVIAGIAVALAGGQPPEKPADTNPAGQVEVISDAPTSTTTVPPTPNPSHSDAPVVEPPAVADPGDTGDVNQPTLAEDLPDVAPGNPVGDVEQRPAPAPAPVPVEQPTDHPTEENQPPTNNDAPAPEEG